MSVQARQWTYGRTRKKLMTVLSMLADYADRCGVAWVGQETLAHNLSCTRRTVLKDLSKLEQDGLIRRVRVHDDGGHRDKNYTVLAPNATDRGPMLDADDGAYPPEVSELARKSESGPAYVPMPSHRDDLAYVPISSHRDEVENANPYVKPYVKKTASLCEEKGGPMCPPGRTNVERKGNNNERTSAADNPLEESEQSVDVDDGVGNEVQLTGPYLELWQRIQAESRADREDRAAADLTDEELLAKFPGSTIEECE